MRDGDVVTVSCEITPCTFEGPRVEFIGRYIGSNAGSHGYGDDVTSHFQALHRAGTISVKHRARRLQIVRNHSAEIRRWTERVVRHARHRLLGRYRAAARLAIIEEELIMRTWAPERLRPAGLLPDWGA